MSLLSWKQFSLFLKILMTNKAATSTGDFITSSFIVSRDSCLGQRFDLQKVYNYVILTTKSPPFFNFSGCFTFLFSNRFHRQTSEPCFVSFSSEPRSPFHRQNSEPTFLPFKHHSQVGAPIEHSYGGFTIKQEPRDYYEAGRLFAPQGFHCLKKYNKSVSLVVCYLIFNIKKLHLFKMIPWLPLPRLYRKLGCDLWLRQLKVVWWLTPQTCSFRLPLILFHEMLYFLRKHKQKLSILDNENNGFILNTCHDAANKWKQGWVFPVIFSRLRWPIEP